MLVLLACSDYEYATKSAADHGDDTGAPWNWTDGGEDGPGGIEEQTDRFVVEGSRAADFVFFGDTSGSMVDELTTLGSKMQEFVDALTAAETDWQLAAITGPTGCAVGGIFDPWTADVQTQFANAILTPPGEDYVDEWGLYNVATAVENTDAGECNEGLLRMNASLHAIFLSDENDDSPGSEDGDPEYWRTYVNQIWGKKGSAADVMLSAIAGPVPDGCAGADPGYGYADATAETGGEFISLCDDWPSKVTLLATESVTQSRFQLSATPVVETLEVHRDGVPDTAGWTYDAAGNYVEFVTDPPVSGEVVQIHYLIST